MYHAQFGRHGAAAFYEMDESKGTHDNSWPWRLVASHGDLRDSPSLGIVGGSELIDYYIGEHCETVVQSEGRELPRSYKQHLIDEFHSLKKKLGFGHEIPDHLQTLHCGDIYVKLTPDIIREAFEKAMREPLEKIIEVFDSCDRSNGDRGPQVIVAGGTARCMALQSALAYLCHSSRLDEPIFVDDPSMEMSGRYPFVPTLCPFLLLVCSWLTRRRSLNVAKGAAYANTNNMTVRGFLDRGAAIGIQVRQAGETVWDDRALILCYKEVRSPSLLPVYPALGWRSLFVFGPRC